MSYNVEERIKKVIVKSMGLNSDEAAALNSSTNVVTDLGADSLDTIELVMGIEDEFGVQFDLDEDVGKFETLGSCVDYVTAFLSGQSVS